MVVRSHEGREPVAPARVERTGACGRGEQATHSGGVGAPPGGQYGLPARSWLTEAAIADGHEKRGPTPKENAGRRAGGRHAFARRRADQGLSRHLARRPLAFGARHIRQNSGAAAPREQWRLTLKNHGNPRSMITGRKTSLLPSKKSEHRYRHPAHARRISSASRLFAPKPCAAKPAHAPPIPTFCMDACWTRMYPKTCAARSTRSSPAKFRACRSTRCLPSAARSSSAYCEWLGKVEELQGPSGCEQALEGKEKPARPLTS